MSLSERMKPFSTHTWELLLHSNLQLILGSICLSVALLNATSSSQLETQAVPKAFFHFPTSNSDDIGGTVVSHLVYNTSTAYIVMLAVTNPTRSGQKPNNTTLNGDFFPTSSLICFQKALFMLFLTNSPV